MHNIGKKRFGDDLMGKPIVPFLIKMFGDKYARQMKERIRAVIDT